MISADPSLDLTSFQAALASLQRAVTRWQATGQQDEELRDACIRDLNTPLNSAGKCSSVGWSLTCPMARPWMP
jgi:hypothetical protein